MNVSDKSTTHLTADFDRALNADPMVDQLERTVAELRRLAAGETP